MRKVTILGPLVAVAMILTTLAPLGGAQACGTGDNGWTPVIKVYSGNAIYYLNNITVTHNWDNNTYQVVYWNNQTTNNTYWNNTTINNDVTSWDNQTFYDNQTLWYNTTTIPDWLTQDLFTAIQISVNEAVVDIQALRQDDAINDSLMLTTLNSITANTTALNQEYAYLLPTLQNLTTTVARVWDTLNATEGVVNNIQSVQSQEMALLNSIEQAVLRQSAENVNAYANLTANVEAIAAELNATQAELNATHANVEYINQFHNTTLPVDTVTTSTGVGSSDYVLPLLALGSMVAGGFIILAFMVHRKK